MLLDQHQVLAVYLNLLQFAYNVFWNNYNLVNNHLCNHLYGLLQFLNCFHMFLNHILLTFIITNIFELTIDRHYYINLLSILYLHLVYITYAFSKQSTIFLCYFFISFTCLLSCINYWCYSNCHVSTKTKLFCGEFL